MAITQVSRASFGWRQPNGFVITALGAALCVALPVLVILSFVFFSESDSWDHLVETVLWRYIWDSILLSGAVSIGVVAIGVPAAWLISFYAFPGRRVLSWLLLLPMAYPAYILAYTYTGLFDFSGPVLTWMRSVDAPTWLMWPLLEMRSIPGAAVMLSLVLYPYVYLLARAAFLEQAANVMEVGYSLGQTRAQVFLRVVIPMARPAIMAGTLLAVMETLADYGTVQFFGIQTFTTGIVRTFYGFGDTAGAAQLASVLLGFVALLVILERLSRRKIQYYSDQTRRLSRLAVTLTGWRALGATSLCAAPMLLGFALPTVVLGYWSVVYAEGGALWSLTLNSFLLAGIASVVVVVVALVIAYANRLYPAQWLTNITTVIGLGYALPGVVVAIGILIPFGAFDQWLSLQMMRFGFEPRLWISGSIGLLIFAYTVRFLAVANGNLVSGLSRIRPSLDHSGRLLGRSQSQVLRQIHVPLMRGSVLTALLICFVDVLKELPATLILRPFDFNTLAVRVYDLAGDERLIDAAPASLMIIAVGLLPVILLNRSVHAATHE
ncbi:MAG: ABC transporter permease [Litorivicinaceae bacterium]